MIYFAYGSNMHRARIAETCASARPLRPARIPNHSVIFTGRSGTWGGGTATIGLAANRDLWGALYEIDEECRSRLEAKGLEDGYVWTWTYVIDGEDERVRAGVLVKVRDLEQTTPSPEYLELLKEAWRQWDLDPAGPLRSPPSEDG
jgi:hypothetical protein